MSGAGLTSYLTENASVVSPKFQPGLECGHVGRHDLRFAGELGLEEAEGAVGGPVVQPGEHAEREHVLRPLGVLPGDVEGLQGLDGHRGDRYGVHVVLLKGVVLKRAALIADLGQVPLSELIGVDDQVAAPGQVLDVGFQGGRVHRDEHVRRVPRREDIVVGELQLETRNACQSACRGPDFGWEIRHGGQVIPEDGCLLGEPVSGELHAVTRIAGEPDNDVIELLDLLGHSWKTSSARRSRALTWHHPTAGGMN